MGREQAKENNEYENNRRRIEPYPPARARALCGCVRWGSSDGVQPVSNVVSSGTCFCCRASRRKKLGRKASTLKGFWITHPSLLKRPSIRGISRWWIDKRTRLNAVRSEKRGNWLQPDARVLLINSPPYQQLNTRAIGDRRHTSDDGNLLVRGRVIDMTAIP